MVCIACGVEIEHGARVLIEVRNVEDMRESWTGGMWCEPCVLESRLPGALPKEN